MSKLIRLRIRKKVLVPTKKQIVHQYRSDWILVGVIDYNESQQLFKILNSSATIENDAQFAKYLYDRYGRGEYSIIAWMKGHVGFWSFIHLACFDNGFFKRCERHLTQEEKENLENRAEYRRAKKMLKSAETQEEKEEIEAQVQNVIEDVEINKEIIKLDKSNKRGPGNYLKTIHPIYKEHEYEEYSKEESILTDMRWI